MNMKFNKYLILASLGLFSIILVTCMENHVLPNFAKINITSDPTGAEVFLDNKKKGITPLELDEILSGSYSILLKESEFIDTTITVEINDKQEMNFDIFMKEINPKGEIALNSNPSGASFFVNNVSSGKKTPSSITKLERGIYNISLRLNLYENSNFQIDLGKDQKVERNTNLVIASSAGSLVITSDPVGAAIYIDDVNSGKFTPSTIRPLSNGEHSVKLILNEYKDTTFAIQVSQSQAVNADIFLKQQNPKGQIILNSVPSGASVFMDDINTEKVTPASFSNLERGNYKFSLRLDLYENSDFEIDLSKDQTIVKTTTLKIASSSGGLFINSSPAGASIFVDNNNTGKTTPDTIRPIVPGSHSIKLLLNNYKDTTFTINIPSGSIVSKNVTLKELFIISTEVNPANSGTITGAGGYVEGDLVILEAFSNFGYSFVNWTENGSEVSDNDKYSFVVNSNRNLVANFELKEYEINAVTNPINAGDISGTGTYKHGEEVTLSTTVNSGYSFVNWTDNLSEIGNETSIIFTADSDRDLVANFNTIGSLLVNSDPIGASIFIDNVNSGEVTPFTYQNMQTGEYQITLKLESFADTTITTEVVTGQTTNLGEVYMRDTTPDVEVQVSHIVRSNNSLYFTFILNQDVNFDRLVATVPPNSELPAQDYGGAKYFEGVGITWTYPDKIAGNWKFILYGHKFDGRKFAFTVNTTYVVE